MVVWRDAYRAAIEHEVRVCLICGGARIIPRLEDDGDRGGIACPVCCAPEQREMTQEERKDADEFFWSQFDIDSGVGGA